ncbi:hypothetical protein RSAG8_11451, partial [Rhizoctonia solani AG-8 WAC10335]
MAKFLMMVKLGQKKQAVSKEVKDKGKANDNSAGLGQNPKECINSYSRYCSPSQYVSGTQISVSDVDLGNITLADTQSSAIEHTSAPIPKSISAAPSPPEGAPKPAPSPVPDSMPEVVLGPTPMDVDDAIEDTAPPVVIEDLTPLIENPAPPVVIEDLTPLIENPAPPVVQAASPRCRFLAQAPQLK